jgi:subtilisin family serine protease
MNMPRFLRTRDRGLRGRAGGELDDDLAGGGGGGSGEREGGEHRRRALSSYNDGGYRALSGTSMATPHAAVIRTRSPTFTAAQARSKLDASVDDKGAAGRDAQFGFGRVNLAKAAS